MELSAEQMQSRLDHIQSCYRRWLELQPKLEAAQAMGGGVSAGPKRSSCGGNAFQTA